MRIVIPTLLLCISAFNPLAAEELPCPVVGGVTLNVTGSDTVSGNCGISTELTGGSNTAGPISGVTVTDTGSLELGVAASLRNHGQLVTEASGELTNLGVLNNGNSPSVYNSNAGGPPPGVILNAGVLANHGELTNHNGLDVYWGASFNVSPSTLTNSGTLLNYGTLNNGTPIQLTYETWGCFGGVCLEEQLANLNNSGVISNASGATLNSYGNIHNAGGTINNAGQMNLFSPYGLRGGNLDSLLSGGTINNTGDLNLGRTPVSGHPRNWAAISNTTLNNSITGTVNNAGVLDSVQLTNDGEFLNTGVVVGSQVSGTGNFTQHDSRAITHVFGSSVIQQGSVSIWEGTLLGNGRIEAGTMTVGANGIINVGSTVVFNAIGDSAYFANCWRTFEVYCDRAAGAGQLEIAGNVELAGQLVLQVGPTGYSSLLVDGDLILDEAWLQLGPDLEYVAGYDGGWWPVVYPIELGSVFDLVTATTISGAFGTVILPWWLDDGLSWHTDIVNEGGMQIFRATVVPIPPALLLFSSALLLMGVWRRRRHGVLT